MEFSKSTSPHNSAHSPHNVGQSPRREVLNPAISPRKRLAMSGNGLEDVKRQRLSTDSSGAGSSESAPSPQQPLPAAPVSRTSSFSIDSIISKDEKETPKPVVPINQFGNSSSSSAPILDPHLAHLAGVAADPRLGLNPTVNTYYAAYAAYAAFAASQMANVPSPQRVPNRRSSTEVNMTTSEVTLRSGWNVPQYRGEPKVNTSSKARKLDANEGTNCSYLSVTSYQKYK